MRKQEFLSLIVLLFLMIVFTIGSFYLASSFQNRILESKNSVLQNRLEDYIQNGYSFKTWKSSDFVIFDQKCKSCVPHSNLELCKKLCIEFLNNTEYIPVDAFVLVEGNEGICYCIYS